MKRALTVLAILVFSASFAFSQEKPPVHKCKGATGKQHRRILEKEQVMPLRLLKQQPVTLSAGCKPGPGLMPRLVFELLIDEEGCVECAELLADVPSVTSCLLEGAKKAVLQFRYSPPKDKDGRVAACYTIMSLDINAVK